MLPDFGLAEALARVPAGGVNTWEFQVPWADPVQATVPAESVADLAILGKHGISSVRELLDARPSGLTRALGLPWSRLAIYRLIARWSLLGATLGARQRLASIGWTHAELERISSGLVHLLADLVESKEERVEVVVQMADVLPREALQQEVGRAERIARRKQHADNTQRDLVTAAEISPQRTDRIWLGNQFFAELLPQEIRRLAGRRAVRRIGPTLPVRACVDQALRRVAGMQLTGQRTGTGVVVALLDSGVHDQHPDLVGRVTHQHDYIGRGCSDEYGHGTHLAGIIAGGGNTYPGVSPGASVWCYRVLDELGNAPNHKTLTHAVEDAVEDASREITNETFVINCSFEVSGGAFNSEDDYEAFCEPFDEATTEAVVVAAAGNAGPAPASITAPGGGISVLTVGASISRPPDNLDVVSPFSSRGPATRRRRKPDLVAPGGFKMPQGDAHRGVSIVGARLAGSTLDRLQTTEKPWQVDAAHFGLSGTSQAAAIVSGLCALLVEHCRSRGRNATHGEIVQALTSTTRPLGYSVDEEGKGLVQVDAACRIL